MSHVKAVTIILKELLYAEILKHKLTYFGQEIIKKLFEKLELRFDQMLLQLIVKKHYKARKKLLEENVFLMNKQLQRCPNLQHKVERQNIGDHTLRSLKRSWKGSEHLRVISDHSLTRLAYAFSEIVRTPIETFCCATGNQQ